ncbi:MAG TPA: hypothetical protein VKM72_16115 [Thermoanaerobaculia bacterium]|nr:hypothetical protein [Thermoanaerobaculia bacterium]
MLAELPAPSQDDYEKMVSGETPVTSDALLLGVLKAVAYQLDEASYDLEGYCRHSVADLKNGFVDPRLLEHLGALVDERERAISCGSS